jgi:hypothetical protein
METKDDEMKLIKQQRLYREDQAREYLGGVSHATMWQARKEGKLRETRWGRSLFYAKEDLDAFADGLREASTTVAVKAHRDMDDGLLTDDEMNRANDLIVRQLFDKQIPDDIKRQVRGERDPAN